MRTFLNLGGKKNASIPLLHQRSRERTGLLQTITQARPDGSPSTPAHHQCCKPNLTVPLRCDPNSYHNGPLETYPSRRGFQLNYWDDDMKSGSFFGLLSAIHSVYGTAFHGYDYVKTCDGIAVLSLEKVPRDLTARYNAESRRPKPERRQHYHEIENYLMRALRFLTNNFTSDRQGHVNIPGYPDHTVTEETAISLESSMEILLMGLQEITQFINGIFTQKGMKPSGELSSEPVCLSTHELMKSLRWCPSELNFMGLIFDNSSFFFAGSVTRQSAQNDHSSCTSSKCIAWEVNESTYRPIHVEGCSGCKEICIDTADLEKRLTTSDATVVLRMYQLLAKKEAKFPWQFLFTDEDVFYLQGMMDSSDNGVEAIQTERGLQFQAKHSCLLGFSEGANIKKCMLLRLGGLSYILSPMTKRGKLRNHSRFWEGADKKKCLDVDPMSDWSEGWKPQYNFRPTGQWGLIPSRGGSSHGVMVAIDEANDKGFFATIVGQVQMYELRTAYSSGISGFNTEVWGQLGLADLDEDKVRQEQERVEREVYDADSYNFVNCVARLKESTRWCVG